MSTEPPGNSQPPRPALIQEAAKFLVNPNVARHPDDQKTSFLQKKGLTETEIQAAFTEAKKIIPAAGSASGPAPPVDKYNLPPPAYPVATYPPPTSPSLLIRIRDISNFIFFICGASYGVYQLYKNYIIPLITGRKKKSVEESVIELQQSVVMVLKEVQTTLNSLEKTLSSQNVRIQSLVAKEEKDQQTSKHLDELKSEITSIKALLINRRTFPSTPSMSPSIPSWQRTKATEKSVEDPPVAVSSVSAQDEITDREEIEDEAVKQECGNGVISDAASAGSVADINENNGEYSNPLSMGENDLNGGDSMSLVEFEANSSDEMSQ